MKIRLLLLAFTIATSAIAQEKLTYQKPPKEILELVDVQRAPSVNLDDKGEVMILLYRDSYKTLKELSEKELRLGGLRINPKTNIGSRTSYVKNIKIQKITQKEARQVTGLPKNARLANFSWSPDQNKIAFTNTVENGVELWVVDVETAIAKKLSDATINANMRDAVNWFKDSKSLLVTMLPENRTALIDAQSSVPSGPTITVSDGKKAQNRTYQDLLKDNNDEKNFETLATSVLYKIDINTGKKTLWKKAAMYSSVSFSPNGDYILITEIKKPFSYIVPFYRFPKSKTVYTKEGKKVQVIREYPLDEVRPKGFMATIKGIRSISWRADRPSTLVYAVALDDGDPAKKVEYRDEIFTLKAPFDGQAKSLFKTKNRFAGVKWGDDTTALVTDYWWNTRNTKTYLINPSNPKAKAEILFDRNYQDVYSNPGNFVTFTNEYGRSVLYLQEGNAFLIGKGFTKKGQFPFVDEMNLKTKEKKRLYQSAYKDKMERLYYAINMAKGTILERIQT